MASDPNRQKILERRARFVAAGLAGWVSLQVVACAERSVADPPRTADEPRRHATDTGVDAGANDADGGQPPAPATTDTDGDGVPDREDQCPNDPGAWKPWGKHGCPGPCLTIVPATDIQINETIRFENGSARVRAESNMILDEIARMMADQRDVKLVVVGHRQAGEATALGRQRAEAVRDALAAKGVDASRMAVEDGGAQHPVADSTTREGRERNRRVEFRVEQP